MRALTGFLLRLLAPAPASSRAGSTAGFAAFVGGAGLACSWLASALPAAALAATLTALGTLAAVAVFARHARARGLAAAPLVAIHLFWLYVAAGLGGLLGWSTPAAVRVAGAGLAAFAVYGALRPHARFRLPVAVPLGLWITACLIGWQREDGVIRCDDYLAIRASAAAAVLVPTTEELQHCRPGEVLRIGHYPRRLWEAPDGKRFVMTAQLGIGNFAPAGRPVADRFPGSVCDVPLDGTPTCFGSGKAQAVVESPARDRLFVAGWQQRHPDGSRGVFYILPRQPPLRPLAQIRIRESVAELYYDPTADVAGLFSDEGEVMRMVRIADGTVLDPIPAPLIPNDMRYDPERGEGVGCFAAGPLRRLDGEAFVSFAFRGHPFSARALGGARGNPSAWISLVWGCDWDPEARRVYVAVASLGLLTVADYDTGRILRRIPTQLGIRHVTLDKERGLLYLANFLRGDVIALDLESGKEVGRWFAGRFVRQVTLTRDRRALLATSNIGVIRIGLGSLGRAEREERQGDRLRHRAHDRGPQRPANGAPDVGDPLARPRTAHQRARPSLG